MSKLKYTDKLLGNKLMDKITLRNGKEIYIVYDDQFLTDELGTKVPGQLLVDENGDIIDAY